MTDQSTQTDATSAADQPADGDLADRLVTFIDRYCTDALARLYEGYPNDVSALVVSVSDLRRFDPDIAADVLDHPDTVAEYFQDALVRRDSPASVVDVSDAAIRYTDLSETETFYPGEFSPSDHAGSYRSIRGEVAKATEVFPKLVEGAHECLQCGTVNYTPGDVHMCKGCERKGPFELQAERSTFVDAQVVRIQTPPEEAGGSGEHLDVRVEDDLAGVASVGDRATISGVLDLEARENDDTRFDVVVDGRHIHLEESDRTDLEVSAEQRERIQALAAGEECDPLDLAAESLAPKIYGYDHVKRMLILAMVGGSRTVHPSGDADRGEFHVLLVGDPSTAKSKLVDRVEDVGWRTVGVSGKGATTAGVTASASQDDFGGSGEWTLSAGAFVKANRGVVCVDELDDMDSEVRAAMLEPMSKQSIHITKAGINTHLRTQTAVVASANPKNGRFDTFTNIISQLTFGGPLLSRFDLVYTFADEPDPGQDAKITDHMLRSRDTAKRLQRGDVDVADEDADRVTPPVEAETLRVWLALAKQQPPPVFESDAVREQLQDRFTNLRGLYDYKADEPVPVTFRKLEATVRIAEAAAKFEFSDVITERHARIATEAVGRSMQDFGKDENDKLDADVQEVGQSRSQKERRNELADIISELQAEHDPAAPIDEIVASMDGVDESTAQHDIQHLRDKGVVYEPQPGYVKFLGWS